jgi:hypothetical protein
MKKYDLNDVIIRLRREDASPSFAAEGAPTDPRGHGMSCQGAPRSQHFRSPSARAKCSGVSGIKNARFVAAWIPAASQCSIDSS